MKFEATKATFTWAAALMTCGCVGAIEVSETTKHNEKGASDEATPPSTASPGLTPGTLPDLAACESTDIQPLPSRLWRINARQYEMTVRALLQGRSGKANQDLQPTQTFAAPLGAVNEVDRFSTRAGSYTILEDDFGDLLAAAEEVSGLLMQSLATHVCVRTETNLSCLDDLVAARGAILFRRPVTSQEVETYRALAASIEQDLGRVEAIRHVFRTMLMSPAFLFRHELGRSLPEKPKIRALTAFEIAESLAFSLTDGPADEELWTHAVNGSLVSPDVIAQQVRRLAKLSREEGPQLRFMREFYRLDDVLGVDKDLKAHSFHKPQLLLADSLQLLRLLLEDAPRGILEESLLTPTLLLRKATASSYGIAATGESLEEGATPWTGQGHGQLGLLMQPTWLVSHSTFDHNDPIRRGRFIRENLLCQTLPVLEITDLPPLVHTYDQTLREELAAHTEAASCRGCHALMDPLGLVFEGFDHLGRPRTTEAGRPVDTSGEIIDADKRIDGPVDGPSDMIEKLASARVVKTCFSLQALMFYLGRDPSSINSCAVTRALAAYEKEATMEALLVSAFTDESFRFRAGDALP